jgi:hypothetical protein
MSVQYREGNRKIRPCDYEELQQMTQCSSCSGSCSCNLGSRSSFDQLQFQTYVLGEPNYAFDETRKLNFAYSVPSSSKDNPSIPQPKSDVNEGYSAMGMVDPYNPYTSIIWPQQSCNRG